MTQPDITLDRPLPQALECERAVLGSILINQVNYWRVVSLVDERDFFKDAHRAIFSAIASLAEEHGQNIDSITVRHALASMKLLDSAGGHAYVSSLTEGIPDIGNVERYARIVREKAKLRSILVACNDAMRAVLDGPEADSQAISSATAAKLQGMAVDGPAASRSMVEVIAAVEALEEAERVRGVPPSIKVNMPTLDWESVLRAEAFTVVGARSKAGKTTLMVNFAASAARNGFRVAFYSLETPAREFRTVLLSHMAGVDIDRLNHPANLTEMDKYKINLAREELKDMSRDHRFQFANRLRDIGSITADARRLKTQYGLDAIFIDYLQLMHGFDERSREQDLSKIGFEHLMLAQDMRISVTAGSQVNKDATRRANGRLSWQDLAGAKAIGEHATVVLLLQRPRADDPSLDGGRNADGSQRAKTCPGEVHFQIEKNKLHATFDPKMHANMSIQTFSEGDCTQNGCGVAREQGRLV